MDNKNSVFPFVFSAFKGESVSVTYIEAVYRQQSDTTWTTIPGNLLDTFVSTFQSSTSEVKTTKIVQNQDKLILRILYTKGTK
jgi:hypothetical protein